MASRTWTQWAASRPAHHWVGEGVIVASLCCFAVSAYFNARYASSLGQDEAMQSAMKIAGLAIASLLALLAIGKHLIDSERHRSVSRRVAILVCLLAVAEVWSAMGAIVTGRSDMVGARKIEAAAVANAAEDRPRLQAELAKLKSTPPAATLRSQMQAMQSASWFAGTANCTQPGSYRNSCARYNGWGAQLGIAERREQLERQLASTTERIATSKGSAQNVADPQSAALATTLGFMGVVASPDTIGLLAPLGIALVLMLSGWWGVEIGFVIRGIALKSAGTARATNDNVAQFARVPHSFEAPLSFAQAQPSEHRIAGRTGPAIEAAA